MDGTGGASMTSMGGSSSAEPPFVVPSCTEAASSLPLQFASGGSVRLVQEVIPGIDFDRIGGGSTQMDLSPDGRHLYVTAHIDKELYIFSRDAEEGTLSFSSSLGPQDGLDEFLQTPKRPAFLEPDGRFMVLPNLTASSVGVWSRSQETGAVVPLDALTLAINEWPEAIVRPGNSDYAFLTVGGERDTIAAVEFDVESGQFGVPIFFDRSAFPAEDFEIPEHLVATGDGRDVYFVAFNGRTLHHMNFDAAREQWTHREMLSDGDEHFLSAPSDLALSADERHLYVTAFNRHRTSVYERNCDTGDLTKVESYQGFGLSIPGPRSVLPTRDGRNVYMTFDGEQPGVGTFARDVGTGRLQEVEFLPVDAESVALEELLISPDGRFLYASHVFPSKILVFERSLD